LAGFFSFYYYYYYYYYSEKDFEKSFLLSPSWPSVGSPVGTGGKHAVGGDMGLSWPWSMGLIIEHESSTTPNWGFLATTGSSEAFQSFTCNAVCNTQLSQFYVHRAPFVAHHLGALPPHQWSTRCLHFLGGRKAVPSWDS
jgi:hypothetical protein